MFIEIIRHIKTGFILFILLSLLTGLLYPAVVTEISQLLFPWQANGSLLLHDHPLSEGFQNVAGRRRGENERVYPSYLIEGDSTTQQRHGLKANRYIGSTHIGQAFTAPYYFNGRPSQTTPFPYNAESSSGSNLGPSNPILLKQVKERAAQLRAANPEISTPLNGREIIIPIDLLTASASGLDPDISPAAALYQLPRIARLRGTTTQSLLHLLRQQLQSRTFGILGAPRLNVLQLNLALDQQFPLKATALAELQPTNHKKKL